MRSRAWCTTVVLVAVLAAGCGGGGGAQPTDVVKGMVLASVPLGPGVFDIFTFCRAVVLEPGTYNRRCSVPWVSELYVGYGEFAPPNQIDRLWSTLRWKAWLDGRRIDLEAFGSSDRTLNAFPAAGFKDVIVRTFDVTIFTPKPGRHTLRYVRAGPHGVRNDVTWMFTVEPR
jgi:hypothetical protein